MIHAAHVVAGGLTGLVVGLTGVGGGALMTPILLLLFGVPPTTAIATDLWFAALTKLVGARVHNAAGQVDWRIACRLWMGSLPMGLAVVLFVAFGNTTPKLVWLTQVIGIALLLTAAGLLAAPKLLVWARRRRAADGLDQDRFKRPLTIAAGAALGACVALTSIGAGALGSVILVCLYPHRMTPHRLIATDLVHAVPLAMLAGLGYLFAGMVDSVMLIGLLCGSIPAVILGSLLSSKMYERLVQVILSGVLIVVGYKTLL